LSFSHSSYLWNDVADGGSASQCTEAMKMATKLKTTQTNKQADFKPEPKNLMLSLELFTLFPSLEQHQRRRRGNNEDDNEADNHSNKQTNNQTS
jgi:hypothetical protein